MLEQPSTMEPGTQETPPANTETPADAPEVQVSSPDETTIVNLDAKTGAAETPATGTENMGPQAETPISVETPEVTAETRTENISKEATVVTIDAEQVQEKARQEKIESIREELEKASEPRAEKAGAEKDVAPVLFEMRPIEQIRRAEATELHIEYKTCEKCKGKGKRFFFFTCGKCRGTGSIPTRKLATAGSGGFLGGLRSTVGTLEFASASPELQRGEPPPPPPRAPEATFAPEAVPRPVEVPVEMGTTQTVNVYEGPRVEATINAQEEAAEPPPATSTGTAIPTSESGR